MRIRRQHWPERARGVGDIAPSPFPRRESSRTRVSSCLRLLPSSSLKGKRGISTGARHSLLAQSKTLGPHRLNAQENGFCPISADRKRIRREQKHSASVYKQAVKQKLGVSCFPTLLARPEAPGRDWNKEKRAFPAGPPLMPCLWGQTERPSKPSAAAAGAGGVTGSPCPEPWQEAEQWGPLFLWLPASLGPTRSPRGIRPWLWPKMG